MKITLFFYCSLSMMNRERAKAYDDKKVGDSGQSSAHSRREGKERVLLNVK